LLATDVFIAPVDLVVVLVLVVDFDGDGDVEVDARPLTLRAASRAVSAISSRGCLALSSTLVDQLHVAVAVKVHDQDHDQVNQDVAGDEALRPRPGHPSTASAIR
jgi:hypothetical protein